MVLHILRVPCILQSNSVTDALVTFNLKETKSILNLAWPVMLSRAAAFLIITVDTAMCGRYSTDALAYYGISSAPMLPALLVGIGMLVGIALLTARAEGARQCEACGKVWRVGLIHAMALGIVSGIILQFGEQILLLAGQSEYLATGGGVVLKMHGYGMAGLLCAIATTLFLEGLQRPFAGMVVMFASNVLNVALNWMFIYGNLGVPEMGAEGAALATAIVRWVTFFTLAAYVLYALDRKEYGLLARISKSELRQTSKNLRVLGYPAAVAHSLESSSFSVMTLFAGFLGVLQTAVWSATMQLIALAFMFALGFSMAASVRVANHTGQRNFKDIPSAGWTAAVLGALVMTLICIAYLAAPNFFAAIYSDDAEVVAATAGVIVITAFVMIPDGLQTVLVGALRGLQDMWFITLSMLVSWWLVMVPIAYYAGVVQNGGATALMLSIGIGAIVAVFMLGARFKYKCRN